MIKFIVLSAIFFCSSANANSTNPNDRDYLPPQINEINLRQYFKKHGDTCALAVGRKNKPLNEIVPIFCFFDGAQNEGGINETTGCMIGRLDPLDGQIYPFNRYSRSMLPSTVGKKCSKEVIETALKSSAVPLGFVYPDNLNPTVREAIGKDFVVFTDQFYVLTSAEKFGPEAPISMSEKIKTFFSK